MSSRGRMLIVDDDARFRATLALDFAEAGFAVASAGSLAEVRAWPGPPPDYALVDLRIGVDSGLDVVRVLRDRHAACQIVIMTGYGSIATAVEAVRLGARDYLTKPVGSADLRRAFDVLPPPPRSRDERVETLAAHERNFIEHIMLDCGGNISKAAKRLGLHRQSLQRKLKKFSG